MSALSAFKPLAHPDDRAQQTDLAQAARSVGRSPASGVATMTRSASATRGGDRWRCAAPPVARSREGSGRSRAARAFAAPAPRRASLALPGGAHRSSSPAPYPRRRRRNHRQLFVSQAPDVLGANETGLPVAMLDPDPAAGNRLEIVECDVFSASKTSGAPSSAFCLTSAWSAVTISERRSARYFFSIHASPPSASRTLAQPSRLTTTSTGVSRLMTKSLTPRCDSIVEDRRRVVRYGTRRPAPARQPRQRPATTVIASLQAFLSTFKRARQSTGPPFRGGHERPPVSGQGGPGNDFFTARWRRRRRRLRLRPALVACAARRALRS